jgi:catechol 2,3-dioxygenase-like lactoylglutathione lyase family enzyme
MRPHVSLNVSDVTKSVEFYKKVFHADPQKQTPTYAKFDLPQLNFSMQSGSGTLSRVNHFGVEVGSTDEVNAWGKRLEAAGISTKKEENTDCCYARQDKVWFRDPDGNAWEVFVVHEQLPIPQERKAGACCG